MQHRLVILGSLYENVYLVIEAKKRGIYTIVCDGYKNGHAKNIADKYYDIDINDTDSIAKMCIKEQADGILGSFSDIVFEKVTQIAAKAGLRWYVSVDKLKYYRDKKEAKELLKTLGANVPENRLINKEFSLTDIEELTFPLVVKPVNGWGSKGIFIAENTVELKELVTLTSLSSGSDTVLVEEYSYGGEYNITSFVVDGKVNIISCGDREKTASDDKKVPRVSRIYYHKQKNNEIIENARDIMQRFADAVNQESGVLSMQCFYDNGKLTVGEIAGRVFAYEFNLISRHSGLYIPKLLIDCIYYADELKKDIIRSKNYVPTKLNASLFFHAKDGYKVDNMDRVFEMCRHEKLFDDIIFYNENDIINNNSNKSYFASFSFNADSLEELDEITQEFYDNMIVLSPNNENIIYPSSFDKTKYPFKS